MKSIFIIAQDEQKITKNLINSMKKASKELSLDGSGPINDETKTNATFAQPDFLITDSTEFDFVNEMVNVCPYTVIIICANDANRANAVVSQFQKAGETRVTYVDLTQISPDDLVQIIINYKEGSQIETIQESVEVEPVTLEDVESKTDVVKDIEENVQNKEMNDTLDHAEMVDDVHNVILSSVVEKVNTKSEVADDDVVKVSQSKTPSVLNEIRSETSYEIKNVTFDITCKTLVVVSKKGGTGKTTLVKEIGNTFSMLKKPRAKQTMSVCLVDLDFDRGNIRSSVGIANTNPNIYSWLSDILDKIEQGESIDNIYFSRIQVMNYLKRVKEDSNFYALITNQGGIPIKLLDRIYNLDNSGNLLERMIKKIIKSLKSAFDVIVIDTDNDVNEMTKAAMELSNNIIYVANPTVPDIESLKVFVDECVALKTIDLSKLVVVLNKVIKQDKFKSFAIDLIRNIKYPSFDYAKNVNTDIPLTVISDIDYDPEFVIRSNDYQFMSTQKIKGILAVCNHCLPIFKSTYITNTIKEHDRVAKKQQMLEAKKSKGKTKTTSKSNKTSKSKKPTNNPAVKEDVKAPLTPTIVNDGTKDAKTLAVEYLSSDLSKVSVDQFVTDLSSLEVIKKTKSGFPIINKQPKKLPKAVWKEYNKRATMEIKRLEKEMKLSKKRKK